MSRNSTDVVVPIAPNLQLDDLGVAAKCCEPFSRRLGENLHVEATPNFECYHCFIVLSDFVQSTKLTKHQSFCYPVFFGQITWVFHQTNSLDFLFGDLHYSWANY